MRSSTVSSLTTRAQSDAARAAIWRGLDRTLAVKAPLTASQWADRYFYLSPESSGTEGRWESLPFQVAILDVCGADEPRIVDLKKSARVGYTKMLDALIGYNLEHKRRNSVMYQPTDGDAKDFCKSEIDTMIRDVPVLSSLSDASENKKRDDTLQMKRLGKKLLYVLGGKAPARFRRVTADTVVYDELDGFDREIGDEGDPLKLGDRCITNSSFPKSVRGSTPRMKHDSLICQEYDNARLQFHYHVRCPECDQAQPLEWSGFQWDEDGSNEDRADSARYVCGACGVPWYYSEIWPLLASGHWETIEVDPETKRRAPGYRIQTGDADPVLLDPEGLITDWPRHVGFHIWAAYSPFMSWADLVLEWLEAQGSVLKLKTFVNHRLGEAFEEVGESVDEHDLFERRENYQVPDRILAVVASVDVQATGRVEVAVYGYGRGEGSWKLDHQVIYGDTDRADSPVWKDLDDYLVTWARSRDDGVRLVIDAVGVDSGNQTDVVYQFVLSSRHRRVFALKGVGGDRPIVTAPTRQKTVDGRFLSLFAVGVDSAKAVVMSRLGAESASPIRLDLATTLEYCEQLTAEKRITKYQRGFARRQWVKKRDRNEALDLTVYCLAALYILNPSWDALEHNRSPEVQAGRLQAIEQPADTVDHLQRAGRRERRQRRQKRGFVNRW